MAGSGFNSRSVWLQAGVFFLLGGRVPLPPYFMLFPVPHQNFLLDSGAVLGGGRLLRERNGEERGVWQAEEGCLCSRSSVKGR